MKHFWLLFSFFLITLSVLPCSDNSECNLETKTVVAQHNNHERHDHDSEQCPPFCSCVCCGIHISQFQPIAFSVKEKLDCLPQKQQPNFYTFSYNKKITLNIWQPPKIS